MYGTKEYLKEYGGYTFEEIPLSQADVLALCIAFYMPLEMVVPASADEKTADFAEASKELFRLMGSKHKKLGLMITDDPSRNLMLMASSKRFSGVKICAVKEVFGKAPCVQYCSGTFILPDGTLLVVYRGTDDTLAGWKEDLDMLLRKGTPSYKIANDYIEEIAAKYDGDIVVCGHSKGGNVALHTALTCSEKVRSRIKGVYNYDGPGFHNNDIYKTGSYDEIKPVYCHLVPSSSTVGMMLAHDYDFEAVKSTKHLGPLQHDMGTWVVENGEIVKVEGIDSLAKIADVFLAGVAARVSDGFSEKVDEVFTAVIDGIDKTTLTEFAGDALKSIKGGADAWKQISPETKKIFKQAFNGSGKALGSAIKNIKTISVQDVTARAFSLIK